MGKVDKKEVFAGLSQEIEAAAAKEAADKAQEAAESERKRKLLEYNMAYTEDRAANAEIPKTATLSEAIALLRTALGVVRNRFRFAISPLYTQKTLMSISKTGSGQTEGKIETKCVLAA
jgi:hypothetical protein